MSSPSFTFSLSCMLRKKTEEHYEWGEKRALVCFLPRLDFRRSLVSGPAAGNRAYFLPSGVHTVNFINSTFFSEKNEY